MGLFDKILSEGAKILNEATSEENKEKAADFLNSLKDAAGQLKDAVDDAIQSEGGGAGKSFAEAVAQSKSAWEEDLQKEEQRKAQERIWYTEDESDTRTCREKILSVLAESFPQYEVRENVSPLTIGGEGRFMDYSIGVYENGVPKLFMMIIGKTTTSHREYRWSREEAEKRGYTFLNFVEHYPNRTDYIKDRLSQYL